MSINSTIPKPVIGHSLTKESRSFYLTMAAVTLIPLLVLSIAHWSGLCVEKLFAGHWIIIAMIGMTLEGHVAATTYLYTDSEFKELIRSNWIRFLLIPLALVGGFAIAAVLDDQVFATVMIVFFCWQFYHYQRQNYGIIAFSAASERSGRPPESLRVMLNLALVSGLLGAAGPLELVRSLIPDSPTLGMSTEVMLHRIAIGTYGLAACCFISLLFRHRSFFANKFTSVFVIGGFVFFLPAIISRDPRIAFFSYAIAHGAQYLIFMVILASQSTRGPKHGVRVLAVVTTVTYLLFLALIGSGSYFRGAYFGIVATHFVIDAKIWRLREPIQRKVIGDRFAFLFD